MLNRLDADGMSLGGMPCIAKFDSVSITNGWPIARITWVNMSWS
jgi:hypothetical protein